MCDTFVKFASLSLEFVELSSKLSWVRQYGSFPLPGKRQDCAGSLNEPLGSSLGLDWSARVAGQLGARQCQGLRVSGLRSPGLSLPLSVGSQASWSFLASESWVSSLMLALRSP